MVSAFLFSDEPFFSEALHHTNSVQSSKGPDLQSLVVTKFEVFSLHRSLR
jgi:hypothetical protein